MRDLLQLLPIYAFMLIPVWIPLVAVTLGALYDVVTAPARRTGATRATRAARATRRGAPAQERIRPAGPRVPAAGTAR